MAPRYISIEALELIWQFERVCNRIKEKQDEMDRDTSEVVGETIFSNIEEIDLLLRHASVRGNLDPSFRLPEVDARSSFKCLRKRLDKQIKAACILADVAHLGPAANEREAEALARIREILYHIYDVISPPASSSGSDSATDTD